VKKFHREREKYRLHAANQRWLQAVNRKHRKYDPNKAPQFKAVLGSTILSAPNHISIYNYDDGSRDYELTIKFAHQLERRLGNGNCLVDFSNTSRITTAALVVVFAAIDSARKEKSVKAEIGWSRKSRRVNEIIRSSGLHKLISGHSVNYALDSSRNMPIVSSHGSNHMDEIVDYIQKRIYNDQMAPETEHAYGDAVSETINNVRLHAYPNTTSENKNWWITCDTFGKKLYLAIYDRGVGIPNTVVERPWLMHSVKQFHPEIFAKIKDEFPEIVASGFFPYTLKKISDERLIYLSMKGDVSGTKQDKHGQGSKSIMALVSETKGGKLWIFSNHGLYTFKQGDAAPALANLKVRFPGTLVQWNIELP